MKKKEKRENDNGKEKLWGGGGGRSEVSRMARSPHTRQRHETWCPGVLHQKKVIETSGIIKKLVEHVGLEQPTLEGSGEL